MNGLIRGAIRSCWTAAILAIVSAHGGYAAQTPADTAIPAGRADQIAAVGDVPLQIYTYRPDGCALTSILLVFHGLGRNAADYRNAAVPIADRLCMLVVAPLFDTARFPTWSYQHGGIMHNGAVQPVESRTVELIPRLVAWIRAREKRPALAYAMLGHSAGGQFLGRVAAYVPNDAIRIVIANPSTWVRPSLDIAAPYGFGGVYDPARGEDALRRYLAEPITVLLGQQDTGSRNLAASDEAEEQGGTRLERGRNAFREAERTARERGWAFHWRLAEVPGVGHSETRMFASDEAIAALRP